MRIILITVANHIYGNYIIKKLIETKKKEIVAIVESEVLLHKKSFPAAILKYLKISGIYYVVVQAVKQEFFKVGSLLYRLLHIQQPSSIFFSYKTMANQYSIPVYKTKNINNASSLNLIKELNPDLIVSIFFNQILGKKLLSISRDCVNIHPAYLPNYKGVSPVFWALANDESYTGVTVHYIDKGIDTGEIIYQEKIPISPNDTEHSLYFKSCEIGISLLLKALTDIESGNMKPLSYNKNMGVSYFSLPTKQAVCQFRKNGRKFFRFREFKVALPKRNGGKKHQNTIQ